MRRWRSSATPTLASGRWRRRRAAGRARRAPPAPSASIRARPRGPLRRCGSAVRASRWRRCAAPRGCACRRSSAGRREPVAPRAPVPSAAPVARRARPRRPGSRLRARRRCGRPVPSTLVEDCRAAPTASDRGAKAGRRGARGRRRRARRRGRRRTASTPPSAASCRPSSWSPRTAASSATAPWTAWGVELPFDELRAAGRGSRRARRRHGLLGGRGLADGGPADELPCAGGAAAVPSAASAFFAWPGGTCSPEATRNCRPARAVTTGAAAASAPVASSTASGR